MKICNLKCSSLLLSILTLMSISFSQEVEDRKRGISSTIQENQIGIAYTYWLSSKSAILPQFSVLWVEDSGNDVNISCSIRRFREGKNDVKPFMSFGVSLMRLDIKDESIVNDYVVGLGLGAEYSVTEQLSLAIEHQLNFAISDDESSRFGNPGGLNINTGTILIATIYFQ